MNDYDQQATLVTPSAEGHRSRANPIGMLAVGLFLALLLSPGYLVLRDFLIPMVWGAVLVYASWPLYWRLCGDIRREHAHRHGKRPKVVKGLFSIMVLGAGVEPTRHGSRGARQRLVCHRTDRAGRAGRARMPLYEFSLSVRSVGAGALARARRRDLRGAQHRGRLGGLEFTAPILAAVLPAVLTGACGQQYNETYKCHSFHVCFLSSN